MLHKAQVYFLSHWEVSKFMVKVSESWNKGPSLSRCIWAVALGKEIKHVLKILVLDND